MRLLRYGRDAVLAEFSSTTEVTAAHAALAAAALPGVVDLVPAARTVLVSFVSGGCRPDLIQQVLRDVDLGTPAAGPVREIVLPVHYDGADLELVARTAGMSAAEVVALHSGAVYTVAFCGFAPGFGYLTGLPEPLRQPRLASPRTRVPAGAVGVAGEFTGVYPRSSPGGWRLLGRTDAVLFDPHRDPPALLVPGDRVRFEAEP